MSNRAALFLQAIRGPILLITIGVLFAVHQAGTISFARTWPLIIIVIGLMKLFERMVAPRPAVPVATPYGATRPMGPQYGPPYGSNNPPPSSPGAPYGGRLP